MVKPALVLALLATATSPALAAGCIKGAAVGGICGHFVGKGHAVAGAAVGCAVGHHRAKVAAKKAKAQAPASN
jgi:outer membrane lipoprotein SlyB